MTYKNVYANRGRRLEDLIDIANKQYHNLGLARIDKVATPIRILNIKGNRVSGFLEQKSTVDYIGTANGRIVVFDAKQTKGNRFPLSNVAEHQMDYMGEIDKLGGIAFIIVEFTDINKIYRLEYERLKDYWGIWQNNKGKRGYASIPLEEFSLKRKELRQRRGIALDYLEGVEGL